MKKLLLSLLLLLTIFSTPAFADVVWPSLYIASGMSSIKVIIVGLIIELFFVKFFTDTRWLKAGIVTFIMNLITCLLGVIIIPISGLLLEFIMYPVNQATFHWTHWVASYFVVIVINTLIEGLVIKLMLKKSYKKNFWWLFGANAISILICVLFYGLRLGMKM